MKKIMVTLMMLMIVFSFASCQDHINVTIDEDVPTEEEIALENLANAYFTNVSWSDFTLNTSKLLSGIKVEGMEITTVPLTPTLGEEDATLTVTYKFTDFDYDGAGYNLINGTANVTYRGTYKDDTITFTTVDADFDVVFSVEDTYSINWDPLTVTYSGTAFITMPDAAKSSITTKIINGVVGEVIGGSTHTLTFDKNTTNLDYHI